MSNNYGNEFEYFVKDFYKIYNYNAEGLSIKDFRFLQNYFFVLNTKQYKNLNNSLRALPPLSIREIKLNSKSFMDKYFNLYDVCYANADDIERNSSTLVKCSMKEFNNILDLITKFVNVYDLDISKILSTDSMFYSFVVSNAIRKGDDRISTFDDIVLGPPYNIISSAVLSHEIVHIQQQGVECVERDFIHDEFLPIFIEKACMDELDPSKQILRLYERHRFSILMNQYRECLFEKDEANILDYLKYIKSTLLAIKMFDMYQHDSDKESYFKDVQKVFDGDMQVEDIIESRKIKLVDCFDRNLLKRHM